MKDKEIYQKNLSYLKYKKNSFLVNSLKIKTTNIYQSKALNTIKNLLGFSLNTNNQY